MKQFVLLLSVIFIGILAYTLYSMMTFQADEMHPFTFNTPTLPPEIQADSKTAGAPVQLSADEEQRKNQIMDEVQKALEIYAGYIRFAPTQVKDTVSALNDSITNLNIPAYYLSGPNLQDRNIRKFETLTLEVSNLLTVEGGQTTLSCNSKVPFASVLVGSSGPDALTCESKRDTTGKGQPDVIFIGGSGNDKITDTDGNRIINAGTGDDTITLGAGRSIVMLDASWGHDTVTVDCKAAHINPAEIPQGFPIPWLYKTTNFIVLGNGLDTKNVVWNGNVLTNTVTGDTLTVNQNCFTVVPSAQ